MSKLIMFCFPYAGGSGSIFNEWRKYLDPSIDFQPIHYAGRGIRFQEPCYKNIEEAINDLYEYIIPKITGKEYAFFGHSMGGLISYEIYKKLLNNGHKPPIHLFMSGVKPPNLIRSKKIHDLPLKKFKKELLNMKGTPKEVLDNKQLMDIFVPILRSDFKLMDEYKFNPESNKLNTNITAMFGKEDDGISEKEIHKWSEFTTMDFEVRSYTGGHFYINENYHDITNYLNKILLGKVGYYDDSII